MSTPHPRRGTVPPACPLSVAIMLPAEFTQFVGNLRVCRQVMRPALSGREQAGHAHRERRHPDAR